jgi:hypothetical protein
MTQPIFPATIAYDHNKGSYVEEYTPSAVTAETFGYGDFVKLVGNVVKLCGADPATILGISEVISEKAKVLTPNGKVPVRTLNPEITLVMSSTTVPVEATHLNQQYGITRDPTSGIWQVDTAKTGASARVEVVRLNVAEGIWYVKPLAAYLSNSGIVS